MVPVIWDAVRVAEREIASARPGSPVVIEKSGPDTIRLFRVRAITSTILHRMAEFIGPAADSTVTPQVSAR